MEYIEILELKSKLINYITLIDLKATKRQNDLSKETEYNEKEKQLISVLNGSLEAIKTLFEENEMLSNKLTKSSLEVIKISQENGMLKVLNAQLEKINEQLKEGL